MTDSDRCRLQTGSRKLDQDGARFDLQVENVTQRLWSRIGFGQLGDRPVFLKQNLDIHGTWSAKQFRYELSGLELARESIAKVVRVPMPLAICEPDLLFVFEDLKLDSMDELLRRDDMAFDAALQHALPKIVGLLEQLRAFDSQGDLPIKQRHFGGQPTCLCFKGLEIRNMGFSRFSRSPSSPLTLFDLGRPFLTSAEEVAAQIFVSVGLLNWGRPIRRFASGPDSRMLAAAKQEFGSWLDPAAVQAVADKERRQRLNEIRSSGVMRRGLKHLALQTLGRRYFHRFQQWNQRHLT